MGPRRYWLAACNSTHVGRAIVVTLLLLALATQCIELRAELLFRSAEPIGGQQHWSDLKEYANPADITYPRTLADGTKVTTEEIQVFLDGYITAEDVSGAKVLERLLKNGSQKIAGNIVSFSSNGGELDASMELGRLLRRLGVSTLVSRDNQCLSSCVFAFMGGDRRSVAGRLGIHRPYFSSTRDVPDRRMQYRAMQKKLQAYIEELDFPPSLYEAVMAVPPESISTVTPADLKRFYLEGMSPSTEDDVDATSAKALGISMLDYLHQKAQTQSCAETRDTNGSCRAAVAGGTAAAPAGARQKDDTAPGPRAANSRAGPQRTDPRRGGASRSPTGS